MTQPKHYIEDHAIFHTRQEQVSGFFSAVLALLKLWHQRSRQRIQLSELSDEMLQDIGINRTAAELESAKPFWQE